MITMLNELTERRQINTFFTNEQSLMYGLQTSFVNVGKGNLTFVRRDLTPNNNQAGHKPANNKAINHDI